MKRIRVLVAHQPRLMRELIMNTIADQPDFELVGEVGNQGDLALAVERVRPDVLILAMEDREKDGLQCEPLLVRYPEMRVLILAPEQNRAFCYWATVDIRSKSLESSEEGILNAMRQPSLWASMAEGDSCQAPKRSPAASAPVERWVH
jgi:chemotaxis response regulator CheB